MAAGIPEDMLGSIPERIERMPTGSKILDAVLAGGYEKDVLTIIYGPAGTGKTTLCILGGCAAARAGKKVIYLDSENNFSVERMQQLAPGDFTQLFDRFIFLRPTTFAEQQDMFEKLKSVVNQKVGLVVVDTIGMLYRLALSNGENAYKANQALGQQILSLSEIARKKNIPVLIANQVYADFENKGKVKMVGGELLRYSGKCLMEVSLSAQGVRSLWLRKHRSLSSDRHFYFKIVPTGILGIKEPAPFRWR